MTNPQDAGHALDWNSPIEFVPEKKFVTLPAGEYAFVVANCERKAYEPKPTSKIQGCKWKAEMTIKLIDANNQDLGVTLTESLYLHSKCMGLINNFFTCIGHRKHGDAPMTPNWAAVIGATGKAKVKLRPWVDQNKQPMLDDAGVQKASNEVEKFLDPSVAPANPAAGVGQATFQANQAWS